MAALSYGEPAETWVEFLPLGDGTLGAMIDGGVPTTRIELNHEGAWSGGPVSERRGRQLTPERAREAMTSARKQIDDGRPDLAAKELAPLQARYGQSYLPIGSLVLRRSAQPDGGYVRRLDLETAVHTLETADLHERAIVSAPFHVLAVESTASLAVDLESPHRIISDVTSEGRRELVARLPSDVAPLHEGDRFVSITWGDEPGTFTETVIGVRIITPGRGGTVVLLAASTTYGGPGRAVRSLEEARTEVRTRLTEAEAAGISAVFDEGTRSHRDLFDRCRLVLPPGTAAAAGTDKRLRTAFSSPGHPLSDDPALAGLLFDVGRYLAISSGRPGNALPPNLQGVWNASMQPPWSSNFTVNINTQMNHWSAHVTNMSETAEPLLDFVEALSVAGQKTARLLYDAPGWVAHHNADAWLFSSPVGAGEGNARWAHWPMAGPWLVRSIWEAHEFGQDLAAAGRVWTIARGSAEFCLRWQHRGSDGTWVTSPATSPENSYLMDDGTQVALDSGSAMDDQLLIDLFEIVGKLAALLGFEDDEVAAESAARLASMRREPAVTADGIVREWAVNKVEADPHHRHLSPLYGLYPGPGRWEAQARAAATKTLERRGDESTGWSLVWKIALWARLGRGDKVGDTLALLFRDANADRGNEAGGLYPNMFAAHPPFQIDANLGYPGALTEALLQSHNGIELLPALPPQLPEGAAYGLVARPGIEVDLEWHGGQLVTAVLRPRAPTTVDVRYDGATIVLDLVDETAVTAADFAANPSTRAVNPEKSE